jgi:nucleotide-binding universal stress UspA family protein
MKVLMAVDGAADGFAAVRQTGRLLDAKRDEVALYYAPPVVSAPSATPEILERARQALATAVFDEARACLPPAFRDRVHTIIGTKPPRHGVLLAAEDWRAELVAVGARGLGPIKKLVLGSVSRAVAHEAPVPVLVVRSQDDDTATRPLRVLLAYDGSECSQQAAQILARFSWPPGTVGRTMVVIESLLVGEVPQWLQEKARSADSEAMAQAWVQEHEAEKESNRAELAKFCGQLPEPFRHQPPIVAEGHAAEKILEAIAAEAIDLVVVGAHSRGPIERMLMGSVSGKVVAHAPCSVLVVRQHSRP